MRVVEFDDYSPWFAALLGATFVHASLAIGAFARWSDKFPISGHAHSLVIIGAVRLYSFSPICEYVNLRVAAIIIACRVSVNES